MVSSKKKYRKLMIAGVFLLTVILACCLYVLDYYRGDTASIEAFLPGSDIPMQTDARGYLVFAPEGAEDGFIFYPGGKVEYTAYIPLAKALASQGTLCVIVEMPCNLAVLDMDAAEGIREAYPQIEDWYIGGHSLGGSMAASYLSGCAEDFEGLVLLGSYSTADLSRSGLSVLSVYGSEDLVMNREKYTQYRQNLPADFTEVILDGGCHAYFGMYGPQDGDGIPSITAEDQILRTAGYIREMMDTD